MFKDKPTTTRRCTARINKNGTEPGRRCKNAPVPGVGVCFRHGGNASHARKAGIERMLMLVEPGMYLLREIIMSEEASYSERMQALKLCLDRVVPVSLNLDATMTHKVPGWENVINGMFAAQQEPQAIEASADGPSLEDLTDAYNERGFIYQEDRRRHAARVLGWDVQSSAQLSSSDVQTLLRDLQPSYSDPGIIEGEVLPEDRSNPPAARARVSRAARVEPTSDALPSYVTNRERAGSARTYGRYN